MANQELQHKYKTAAPELYSTNHLLWLGMQNSTWNQFAREILAGRGEAYAILRRFERIFKERLGFSYHSRRDFEDIDPKSWLAPTPTGTCVDCGHSTSRKYNGYWQCPTCADGCKSMGHAAWKNHLEDVKAEKRKKLNDKTKEKLAEKPERGIIPSDVIGAYEASYADLLQEGADSEAIKAAGDREIIDAAQHTYAEHKTNSPLAKTIREVRDAA